MKRFFKSIVDFPKLIFRLWLSLWIILIMLLIMKFCFKEWYPIVVDNKFLLKLNNFMIKKHIKDIILFIFYYASVTILYLISCMKRKYTSKLEFIIVNLLIIICSIIKIFSSSLAMIPELILLIILPIIYLLRTYKGFNKAKLILYVIAIQILVMVWQLNIYLVRGINFGIAEDKYFLIGFILQLDYYIFLITTFLEVNYMGRWSAWFFGKDITVLKAEKEKELAKVDPNMEKVAKLDSAISAIESKNAIKD